MRKVIAIAMAIASLSLAAPASASGVGVRLVADLECLAAGGAHISFTIENVGPRRIRIDPDFHLILRARRVGDDVGAIAFVFPAPGFDVIPRGESRTFEIDLGEAFEGLPGTDLSGLRLHLEAEVSLRGRTHPAVRTFSYPACDPPA
jgi:hypothetical protein